MPTVIVQRLEVEPAPAEAAQSASDSQGEARSEPEPPSRHDIEKALRELRTRAARLRAH